MIEKTKGKLLLKYNNLNDEKFELKYYQLRKLWEFMHSSEIIKSLVSRFQDDPLAAEFAQSIVEFKKPRRLGNEIENIALSYKVLEIFLSPNHSEDDILRISLLYTEERGQDKHYYFEIFDSLFIKPLIEYLVETIDNTESVLFCLSQFKHKTEWFNREELSELIEKNSAIGEYSLSQRMYEFLFDQGINFTIEPKSPSGKVDFIADQGPFNRIIADLKIFNVSASKGKQYILKGFGQVYHYLKEYNEQNGYLIIFKSCEEELVFNLPTVTKVFNKIVCGNKSIYFIVIDIFTYENPASKRGKPKLVEISEADLIGETIK